MTRQVFPYLLYMTSQLFPYLLYRHAKCSVHMSNCTIGLDLGVQLPWTKHVGELPACLRPTICTSGGRNPRLWPLAQDTVIFDAFCGSGNAERYFHMILSMGS